MKHGLFFLAFCLSVIHHSSFAQPKMSYGNKEFQLGIKSVQFYNRQQEQSFPILTLGSDEQLQLYFDDFYARGSRNFNYTIEHCDADWNSSGISPADYLQGFTEDRINDYDYAVNTLQKYTSYSLRIPNQQIIPRISGNYLLKVYEESDPTRLVLTRKFYVVDSKVTIGAEITPSNTISKRQSNQKINFQIDYPGLPLQNPYAEIRTLIMQNQRENISTMTARPQYVRGNQLLYNDVKTNDFAGGNEFRYFDLRSLRLNSQNIDKIYRDTANTAVLLTDVPWNESSYSFRFDNDGNYFIRNEEGTNSQLDADYAHVHFSLAAKNTTGDIYLVGRFNNYKIDANSKMSFDASKSRFYTDQFLKQGIYDYHYVLVNPSNKAIDDTAIDGSYFQTENDYQILVYYRRPGARWEELVGFKQISSAKK